MKAPWWNIFLVGVGGGLGSIARFMLAEGIRRWLPGWSARFPAGIWVVNVSGCLLFGLILGVGGASLSPERRLFLLTGVLGGFTTFSTFGHDTARLLGGGETALGLLNAVSSVVCGVAAVFFGQWCGARWAA